MPRTLKRRSDAINNDNDNDPDSPEPPRRRVRSSSASSAASSNTLSPNPDTQAQAQDNDSQTTVQTLIKKLVRLALATEYARLPLRRSDISQKILKDNAASHKLFKPVFAGAQRTLAAVFGMTLVELPSRERTTLKDRRAQATQTSTQKSQSATNKSWILVSTLPKQYKADAGICVPARGSGDSEAEYTALYSFVLAMIYLNGSVVTDAKLERYMKRMNADTWTAVGATDKLLQRMVREGYVERRRDVSSGEEVVEWVVGPRGKVEVGVRGVVDLVKAVYGFGKAQSGQDGGSDGEDGGREESVKIEEEELDRKLERSLGVKITEDPAERQHMPVLMDVDGDEGQETRRTRRGRPRKNNHDDEDD